MMKKYFRFHLGFKNKKQKGMALLLAMFTMTIVSYLAIELSYDTNVEYIVNAQSIQRVKAYYAARSAMNLSLLRIKIYAQVQQQFGKQLGGNSSLIDMIWNMPFAWPPILPDDLNEVDKGMIKDKIKESTMDAAYLATISDEGSKIDLNDLNSPSKVMADLTKKRLIQIFENKKRDDETWARQNPDLKPEEIVNNIQDWGSPGRTSANGGDKAARFASLGEGYPPNRAFRTVDEIRLVPGITETVFDILKDQVTVFGMRAINPNHADKEVLMSLDPTITPEVAGKLIERRNNEQKGGPFKDAADFWNFVSISGGRVDPQAQQGIPLIFSAIYNFRIKATGNFKSATREITAIVYDLQKSAQQISDQIKKEDPNQKNSGNNNNSNPPTNNGNQSNNSVSKGAPRVVYWNER